MDKIGKGEPTLFQKGGHVAHVQIPSHSEEQDSTSTSGIYSEAGSEGSTSPEYNTFRNRVASNSNKRWSIEVTDDNHHIARLVVGEDPKNSEISKDTVNDTCHMAVPPSNPKRRCQGEVLYREDLEGKLWKDGTMEAMQSSEKPLKRIERSNSRVKKVSNLIRWPKKQEK